MNILNILNSYKPSLEKLLSGFYCLAHINYGIIQNKVHCLKNNIPDPKSYWLTSTSVLMISLKEHSSLLLTSVFLFTCISVLVLKRLRAGEYKILYEGCYGLVRVRT